MALEYLYINPKLFYHNIIRALVCLEEEIIEFMIDAQVSEDLKKCNE